MKQFFFIFLLGWIACGTPKETMRTQIVIYLNKHKRHFVFILPRHFSSKTYTNDNFEVGSETRYWYRDSAVFYVTDTKYGGNLNYSNMHSQSGALSKLLIYDTIALQGIDEKGKYWKQLKLHWIYIGYRGIPIEKKEEFDRAIDSWKVK